MINIPSAQLPPTTKLPVTPSDTAADPDVDSLARTGNAERFSTSD